MGAVPGGLQYRTDLGEFSLSAVYVSGLGFKVYGCQGLEFMVCSVAELSTCNGSSTTSVWGQFVQAPVFEGGSLACGRSVHQTSAVGVCMC